MAACAVFAILSLSGCTKYDPYTGEAFDCNCGNLTWDNRELNMRMAEVEDLGDNVYRNHIIADMREPFEIEEHSEPRVIVLTLTTELLGPTTTIGLAAGEDDLVLQQIDSPGAGTNWYMGGASLVITKTGDTHEMSLTSLIAQRGNTFVAASGQFTFDLAD